MTLIKVALKGQYEKTDVFLSSKALDEDLLTRKHYVSFI